MKNPALCMLIPLVSLVGFVLAVPGCKEKMAADAERVASRETRCGRAARLH